MRTRFRSSHGGRRVMLALGTALAAASLAAGCGDDSENDASSSGGGATTAEAENKPINVAFFTALGNTYLEATGNGLEEGFKGEDVTVKAFDSKFDPQKQFSQVQDAIASGKYDAFVIFPVDGNGIIPMVNEAADAGIKVIDTDYPIGPKFDTSEPQTPGIAGSVLLPAVKFGDALGNLTLEACEGVSPCEVALIPGFLKSPFDNAVMGSIEEIVKTNPDIEIVAKQEGQLLADPALGVVQNVLQSNPGLDVVTAIGDQMANGAEKAITSAGKTGDVKIIGASASEIGVKAVKEKRWFGTSVSVPYTEGVVAARMVLQAVREGKVEPNAVNPVEEAGLPGFISINNLDEFPADFVGEWKG